MKTGRLLTLGVLVLGLISGQVFGGTEGPYDTFYGANAGAYNGTARWNTFIGNFAGFYNSPLGQNNTFIGYAAGYNNTSGTWNTFLGNDAGHSNITGNWNTFLGYKAGYSNTASNNIFVGVETGTANTTGHDNTFMGNGAGLENSTGNYNIFLGPGAGQCNTTGGSNTIIGYGAGLYNGVGSNNTLIGYQAGALNNGGGANNFLGQWAGYQNTTGDHNIFIGNSAGYHNTTGVGNVFLGNEAGGNATGSNMLYIANSNTSTPLIYGEFDNQKMTINGDLSVVGPNGRLQLTNTTADNTNKSGFITSNHYSNAQVPITFFRTVSNASANLLRLGGGYNYGNAATQIDLYTAANTTTLIGTSRLTIKNNGYIGIGTQSPSYALQMAGGAYTDGTTWYNASSREYKKNIQRLGAKEALAALASLNPVTFTYKTSPNQGHVGFIAEEVPELLATKDRKGLSAMDIVAVLTKALQEQQKTIEEQQKIIQDISTKMVALENAFKMKGN